MADNALVTTLTEQRDDILAHLPSWCTPDRWWAMAVEVAKNPALQKCTPLSLLNAIKRIADWGLELDGEEAVVIPYGNEATPTAMVRGVIRRAIEAGAASHIYAELVCEHDTVEIVSGSNGRTLNHKIAFPKRGRHTAAYAVAILPDGITDFELFDASDIEAVKKASMRITGGKLSPAWTSFEGEMIKKSVIRRLCKRLRGKREGEAGERFNALRNADTRFDKETTGNPLPPDEYPDDDSQPPHSSATVADKGRSSEAVSTPAAGGGGRLLNDDESFDLMKRYRTAHPGTKTEDFLAAVAEHFQRAPEELRTDEMTAIEEALEI